MLNSVLQLGLTALSRNCCQEQEGEVTYLFIGFNCNFCHSTPCNIFLYALTSLVVIPELRIFMPQEGTFASTTCQITGFNFFLPYPACYISSALERTAQPAFNENVMHKENLQLIFLWANYCHPIITIFSTDKDTTWTTDLSTNVRYQINSESALTWHQARKSCQQQNAELLSITDVHEQTYLKGKEIKQMLTFRIFSVYHHS